MIIAIDHGNSDKKLMIKGPREPEVLDFTEKAESPASSSPTSEGERAASVPRFHEYKEDYSKREEEKKSTADTKKRTTDPLLQDTGKPSLFDIVVFELEESRKRILEIAISPYLVAAALNELTEEQKARAISWEFYHFSEHDMRYYAVKKDSKSMNYPEGVEVGLKLPCTRCFAEAHRGKCDIEVREKNHHRQLDIAKEILSKLFFLRYGKAIDITGNLKDHRVICENCEVPVFRLIDQKLVICFICGKILKGEVNY